MKTGTLVVLNVLVAGGVAVGVRSLWPEERPAPSAPPAASAPAPGESPEFAALRRRLDDAEARLAAAEAGLATLREDLARQSQETAKAREEAAAARKAAEEAVSGAAASLLRAAAPKPEDRFREEVTKAIKREMQKELKQIYDLAVNPTPEMDQRRAQQLRMIAGMFASQVGLDAAGTKTLGDIISDTDREAREQLRPILADVKDAKDLDYTRLKGVVRDAFTTQDTRIEQSFTREQAEGLKRQMEPIRAMFTSTLDDLEKQARAPAEASR